MRTNSAYFEYPELLQYRCYHIIYLVYRENIRLNLHLAALFFLQIQIPLTSYGGLVYRGYYQYAGSGYTATIQYNALSVGKLPSAYL